jgi:hypothetical protein
MRNLVVLVLLAALPASAAQAPARQIAPSIASTEAPSLKVSQPYRVKQQGGGLGIFVDEAVVFHRISEGPGPVWVMERRRRDQNVGVVTFRHDWIDGRTCPALEKAIAEIGRLPPIAMAGLDTEPRGWVSDVPEVTLIGPPAGGRMGDLVLRRDLMGPVSRWWRASSKALETCWRAKQPYIAGAYDLRSKLSTAQDEVEIMRPY